MGKDKRKEPPTGNDGEKNFKRSKGGSGGKWQTPSHKAKLEHRVQRTIQAGDVGIWGTCARGQEGRATTELKSLLYQFAEEFYGITAEKDDDEDEELDIEASIKKEAAAMNETEEKPKLFSAVRIDIECVLFFKVQPPIDPVEFCHRICKEIASNPQKKLTRYINRLSPMTVIGKATEKGLEELIQTVLPTHFQLAAEGSPEHVKPEKNVDEDSKQVHHAYAIRPTIRNHNTLTRDVVIKQIASSIGDIHKVNLNKPDKVILVEIYQTVCGMSVVPGDWEELKRYNLAELYQSATKTPAAPNAETTEHARERTEVKKNGASTTGSTATDSAEPK